MKSKITKIQSILMKGIASIILILMILSCFAVINVNYAAESEEEATGSEDDSNPGDNFIFSEDDEKLYKALQKDIEAIKKQIKELNSGFDYEKFVNDIATNNTIKISSEVELRALSAYVASGNTCSGKVFKLEKNISLTDTIEWNPIGDNVNKFEGTIDGAGYTVSGMLISIKQSYAGLIGYLNGGTVKNLNIANSKINIPAEVDNKLQNDIVSKSAVSYSYLGAIAGYANGATISNCKNSTSVNGGNYVGGIVGSMINGHISNCSNSGTIKGYRSTGGIAGSFRTNDDIDKKNAEYADYTYIIYKCVNKGRVHAITVNSGGICGDIYRSVVVRNCLNQGEISVSEAQITLYVNGKGIQCSPENVGGIVGWASGKEYDQQSSYDQMLIQNCINDEQAKVYGYQDAGGIAGQLGGVGAGIATAKNCIVYTEEIKSTINPGGIAGCVGGTSAAKGSIINCYYTQLFDNDKGYGANLNGNSSHTIGNVSKKNGKYVHSTKFTPNPIDSLGFETDEKNLKKYIDKTAPTLKSSPWVKVDNNGNSQDFAVKGDELTIKIHFSEYININRIEPSMDNATFIAVGEDGLSLVFKYKVQGNEDEKTTLKLSGKIYDTFGNESDLSQFVNGSNLSIKLSRYITIINNSNKSMTQSKDFVTYKIVNNHGEGHIIDGNLYFKQTSQISIYAIFEEKLYNAIDKSEDPVLYFKVGDTTYNTKKENAKVVKMNNNTIYYEISTQDMNGELTDVYLTTENDVLINGVNKGKFNQNNTGVIFSNVYVDTMEPTLNLSASVNNTNENNRYTVGEDILITATTSEEIRDPENSMPQINVSFSTSGLGKYNYQGENAAKGNAKYIDTITNSDGKVTYRYRYTIQQGDEGNIKLGYAKDTTITDIAGNTTTYTTATDKVDVTNIYADTTLPTVKITAMDSKYDFNNDGFVNKTDATFLREYILNPTSIDTQVKARIEQNGDVNGDGIIDTGDLKPLQNILSTGINITNEDKIQYTFTWSEEVTGFTADDITVNGGTKGALSEVIANEDGTYSYIMTVTNSVASGNTGNIQVIVEQNAVQDLVGYGNVRTESVITVDKKAPTVEITADKEYVQVGETITYTFNWSEAVTGFDETDITVNNATKEKFKVVSMAQYTLQVTPTNGNDVEVSIADNKCTDIAGNNNIGNKHIISVLPTVKITAMDSKYDFNNDGFVDITDSNLLKKYLNHQPINDPEVEARIEQNGDVNGNGIIEQRDITALQKILILSTGINITNEDKIQYTFTWSEEVTGFTADDITVNGGTKGALSEVIANEDGTYSYIMTVTNSVASGNTGNIQVIVEQNAVQDLNGYGNVRTESVITVDKKAPMFIGLEAYATSNISVDEKVDTVKEYYKVGDTVTIVATFDENIKSTTTVPTLALQFSESGNAKGPVSTGKKDGNKITYTYTITAEDMGTLSVKGFSGTVKDAAGNETIVTKRALDGDTVIADTEAPTLVGITAIAQNFEYDELLENPGETKRYGITSKTRGKNTITIIAEYSENIYELQSNIVNNITRDTAPKLKLKFVSSTEKTATFDKIENNKIYYTYHIVSGDKGDLTIASLTGTVSDIAGNTYTTSTSTTLPELGKYEDSISVENKVENITADTENLGFIVEITASDKDDNGNTIKGNSSYYRKGSIITVTVKTKEYVYKNNNKELTRFAENGSDAPRLNISFAASGTGFATCTNVEYKNKQTIFKYTYTIKENDNGQLTLNIAESQVYDIALNGNDVRTNTISTIIADTVNPVTNWQSWVESEQYGIVDNQNGTWKVTFNEKLYVYDPNTYTVGSSVSASSAPILLVSNDNEKPLETTVSNITTINNKTVITYSYSPYTKNLGAFGMKFASVSDKAGNLFNYKDQVAPTLSESKLEVTSPKSGTYKAGEKVTIEATFSEKVSGTPPVLKLKFGENDAKGNVSTGVINENKITYTYTITATDAVGNGDNGKLSIKSFTGTGLKDLSDNLWVAPNSVTLTGSTITADTIAPTLTITSDVARTNKDVVTYTFTWSEAVTGFKADDIEVTNGLKGTFKPIDEDENGYALKYTLEVDTTGEGRQIVKVGANVCTDIAGNQNVQRATYNQVVIDYTKPEVRAKVNGGKYVIGTDNKKSTLKETLVVNEEVSKFEYIWSKETTIPETGFKTINPDEIQINSDIKLETQVAETATYYLYMKVTDLAGNTFIGRTNGFVVSDSKITLTSNKTTATNQDVTVAVSFGEGLTQDRKAGIQGKTQSADSTKVIIGENGTVYAEATDIAGNKVYNTLEITNIDKTAPKATIKYTTNEDGSVTATITFDETATVTNNDGKPTYKFTENGEFTFEFVDSVGNKGTATAKVTSINKKEPVTPTDEKPIITDVNLNNKQATIITNITDSVKYAITSNNTIPSNSAWQNTNAITVNIDGKYYAWAKKGEKVSDSKEFIVDTEGPIISRAAYSNGKITIETKDLGTEVKYVGLSNSADAVPKDWTEVESTKDNNGLQTGMVTITANGDYYIWAKDKTGNVNRYNNTNGGKITVTGFGGTTSLDIIDYSVIATPDQSEKYILVEPNTTDNKLKEKINVINGTRDKLSIEGLVTESRLKTGSIVKYDNEKKYTVVVNGDVNGDGKVNLLDIIKANSIRINGTENKLEKAKLLAIDLNRTERVELRDIMSINRIRINSYN